MKKKKHTHTKKKLINNLIMPAVKYLNPHSKSTQPQNKPPESSYILALKYLLKCWKIEFFFSNSLSF